MGGKLHFHASIRALVYLVSGCSDNQLTDINFTLSCLPKLRYLDLEYNKVGHLKEETKEGRMD